MIKKFVLMILKRLSSKALFFILNQITYFLELRDDNSMNHDAKRIRRLILNNYVYTDNDPKRMKFK